MQCPRLVSGCFKFRRSLAAALCAALCSPFLLGAVPAKAEGWWIFDGGDWRHAKAAQEPVYAVSLFGGEGTESDFSEIFENVFDEESSGDRVLAITGARRLFWFRDQLSIDAELMYAHHFGRESYHEFGGAVYLRWHDFPWNSFVETTLAASMGPSYTTTYPALEAQPNEDDRSKLLNQLNLEVTAALPSLPRTQMLARLQHRSGMFGFSNGVSDASSFLTLGIRQEF